VLSSLLMTDMLAAFESPAAVASHHRPMARGEEEQLPVRAPPVLEETVPPVRRLDEPPETTAAVVVDHHTTMWCMVHVPKDLIDVVPRRIP
jgi:hypothetical protein